MFLPFYDFHVESWKNVFDTRGVRTQDPRAHQYMSQVRKPLHHSGTVYYCYHKRYSRVGKNRQFEPTSVANWQERADNSDNTLHPPLSHSLTLSLSIYLYFASKTMCHMLIRWIPALVEKKNSNDGHLVRRVRHLDINQFVRWVTFAAGRGGGHRGELISRGSSLIWLPGWTFPRSLIWCAERTFWIWESLFTS